METRHFRQTDSTLNTVGAGLLLAGEVVAALRSGANVSLDLNPVERMTPSFANALVMTIADAIGPDEVRLRIAVATSSPLVAEGWSKALERYERGLRLSTQRPGAA